MQHLNSFHALSVLDALEALRTALARLAEPLIHQDADLPLWFDPPPSLPLPANLTEREKVFCYLSQMEYLDEQDPREILIGPGIVAASSVTLQAVHDLNLRKQAFKSAMLQLKAAQLAKPEKNALSQALDDLLNQRPASTARTLKRMGLARLHLKQCYRVIPYFLEKPERIAWTWANTRSISRISVEEAERRLLKQGLNDRTTWQRQKLAQLPRDEPLAIVQDLAPHLRANLVFRDNQDQIYRKMVKGPLPFFYEVDLENGDRETLQVLPRFRVPGDKKAKDKNRPPRKDVKLEPLPFLPAIRAHRYRVQEESIHARVFEKTH